MKSRKQQTFSIGLLKLRKINKKSKNHKENYALRDLKDSECYLDDGKYDDQVRNCFTTAIQANFTLLSLQRNNENQILQQISLITFKKLRVLDLSRNFIETIEPLAWLNALNLRVLDLKQNLIVNSKPLAKFYTKSLSELKIGQNLFGQLKSIEKMIFRSNDNERDFSIRNNVSRFPYNIPISNLTFLGKLQEAKDSRQQWISIYAANRIKTPKLYKVIQEKSNTKRTVLINQVKSSIQFDNLN